MTTDNMTLTVDRVLQTVGGILLTITLGIQGWLLTTMLDHSDRLTHIEASRFTANDAMRLTTAITRLQAEERNPPAWFVDQVRDNSRKLEQVQTTLNKVEEQLQHIHRQ